jgi:hypothetical protein
MPYGTGAHVVKPPTSIAARFMSAMAVPPPHNFGRGAARSLGDDGRVICREFDVPPDARSGASADDCAATTYRFALLCALASVLGGLVGYALGALLFETAGRPLIDLYGLGATSSYFGRASPPGDPGSLSQRGLPRSRSSRSLSRVVHSGSTSAGSCLPASSRGADVTCCSQYCCSAMGLRCAPRSSAA